MKITTQKFSKSDMARKKQCEFVSFVSKTPQTTTDNMIQCMRQFCCKNGIFSTDVDHFNTDQFGEHNF